MVINGYGELIVYGKSIFTGFLVLFVILSCSRARNHNKSDYESGYVNADAPADEIEDNPAPVMVYYEGDLLNIFFHPLVARPEVAFTGSMKDFFREWYVTADEFKKILNELYMDDYVLIHIDEFYDVSYVDGVKKVTSKKLLVPAGKKPMVISIDDLSYYEFVRENGSVHKLVIDKNGGIAAWTNNANGGELSYDLDVVTIIEDFIRQHPDFSVRGAKGIIALTGYEGVLGYQTHAAYEGVRGNPSQKINDPGYIKEVEGAIAVVNRLKELGWRFASHSWGHLNMPDVPMSWFMNDINRWEREVWPILGDTDLYIYPFGAGLESREEKHKVLREKNFNLFFGVGNGLGYSERGEYIYLTRKNIDGSYFRIFGNSDNKLFNIDKVIDKEFR